MRLDARDLPVLASADVVVAGGGPAGLGAALAAARTGASVVLMERYGFLGGNFTAASVGTICGLYLDTGSEFDFVVGGIAREFADALAAAGAGVGPVPFKRTAVFVYVPWAAKRLADRLVGDTEAIDLLLHTLVAGAIVEDRQMRALVVATKRGLQAVNGSVFIDCTGDADVATFAGVPTELGGIGGRQHASMQFMLQHADPERAMAAIASLGPAIDAYGADLSRDGGALIPTLRPGEFIGAMTRVRDRDGSPVDITDVRAATRGELEGRRLAEEAAEFVRAHIDGFADAFLADTAATLGVRETRHIVGASTLTGAEVAAGAAQPDAIARGAWPREYHVHDRSTEYEFLDPGAAYDIPFGALRAAEVTNLLVAGRCISADHDALASTRVMAPSMAIGQAAGTAAGLSTRSGTTPDRTDIAELQAELRAAGVLLE